MQRQGLLVVGEYGGTHTHEGGNQYDKYTQVIKLYINTTTVTHTYKYHTHTYRKEGHTVEGTRKSFIKS